MTIAPTEARSALCLGLAVLLCMQGCASYKAVSAPIRRVEAMPVSRTVGLVTVAADPYVSDDRRNAVFGPIPSDVLPIQVVVQNDGPGTLIVRYAGFALEIPGGWELPEGGHAAAKVPTAMPVAARDRCHTGFGCRVTDTSSTVSRGANPMVDLFAPFIFMFAVVTYPVWAPMVIIDSVDKAKASANADQRADYLAKEFKGVTLASGDAAHGFVYFVFPAVVPAMTGVTLVVQLRDSEGDHPPLEIRLPLDASTDRLADPPLAEAPR